MDIAPQQYPILYRVNRPPRGRRNRNPTPIVAVVPVLFVRQRKDMRGIESRPEIAIRPQRWLARNDTPLIPLTHRIPKRLVVSPVTRRGGAEQPGLVGDTKGT
jgi:hypothetical protein